MLKKISLTKIWNISMKTNLNELNTVSLDTLFFNLDNEVIWHSLEFDTQMDFEFAIITTSAGCNWWRWKKVQSLPKFQRDLTERWLWSSGVPC